MLLNAIQFGKIGKIGRLTPIKYIYNKEIGRTEIECICDCGNKTMVLLHNLRRGNTKSCGCIKVEKHHKLGYGVSNCRMIIKVYQRHAKDRNISFQLTDNKIKELFSQSCFYCDAKPSNVAAKGRSYGEFIYNGVDRIDNSKGYTIDNCVSCCRRCNALKSNMSIQEFKEIIQNLYNRINIWGGNSELSHN